MLKPVTKIKIRGIEIFVYLQDHKDFCKEGHADCYAYCSWIDKKIVFQTKDISYLTIVHELTHMYIKTGFIDHIPDINVEQLEEMFCEIMAYFGEEIIKTSKNVHKILKERLKNGKSKN